MSNCTTCEIDEEEIQKNCVTTDDPMYDKGSCKLDENGYEILVNDEAGAESGCVLTPTGLSCPQTDSCNFWDLTDQVEENCFIDAVVAESIEIGGAIMNVHRLLGVHEQGSLQDLVGAGAPISGGSLTNFPANNAFDKYITEWRSSHIGSDVTKSSFIGYDFGPLRLPNGRHRYGIETAIKYDVNTIKIKQGCDPKNRVTKARIERSADGKKWFGVSIVDLADCDGLVTVSFKRTVPSRFWRIRPIQFNGGADDYWSVQALQLIDYEKTHISNIQDRIWVENRDRDYDTNAIRMKGVYTPVDVVGNQTKWGFMQDTDKYVIEVNFNRSVALLGRPFIIGDIIELPSEMQYRPNMTQAKKYIQVIDVGWSVNGYTPSWKPTLTRIIAEPIVASQETQQITGKLTPNIDSSGLSDIDNGGSLTYHDASAISATIKADANTMVPQMGEDNSSVTKLSPELLAWGDSRGINLNKLDQKRNVLNKDAMPRNGAPYTEGDTFPSSPNDGDYHRLTFSAITKTKYATRLYRWSAAKTEWTYLETDGRNAFGKARLEEYTDPTNSSMTPIDGIDDTLISNQN